MNDAVRSINLSLVSGFSNDQIFNLTDVANRASRALGVNLTDAFDRVIKASAKVERELLDELGIFVRLDRATRDYATGLGISVSELTEYQKSQAFTNAVIDEGLRKFDSINTNVATSAQTFNQFSARLRDIATNTGIALADFTAPFADALLNNTGAMVTAFSVLFASVSNALRPVLEAFGGGLGRGVGRFLTGGLLAGAAGVGLVTTLASLTGRTEELNVFLSDTGGFLRDIFGGTDRLRARGIFGSILEAEIEQFKELNNLRDSYVIESNFPANIFRPSREVNLDDIRNRVSSSITDIAGEPGWFETIVNSILSPEAFVGAVGNGIARVFSELELNAGLEDTIKRKAADQVKNLREEISDVLTPADRITVETKFDLDIRNELNNDIEELGKRYDSEIKELTDNMKKQLGRRALIGALIGGPIGAAIGGVADFAGQVADGFYTSFAEVGAQRDIGDELLGSLTEDQGEKLVNQIVAYRKQIETATNVETKEFYSQLINLTIEQAKHIENFDAISKLVILTNREAGFLTQNLTASASALDVIFEFATKDNVFGQAFNFEVINEQASSLNNFFVNLDNTIRGKILNSFKSINDFTSETLKTSLLLLDTENAREETLDQYSKRIATVNTSIVDIENAAVKAAEEQAILQEQVLTLKGKERIEGERALTFANSSLALASENLNSIRAALSEAEAYRDVLKEQNMVLEFQESLTRKATNPMTELVTALRAGGGSDIDIFSSLLGGFNPDVIDDYSRFLEQARNFASDNNLSERFATVLGGATQENVLERIVQLKKEARVLDVEAIGDGSALFIEIEKYNTALQRNVRLRQTINLLSEEEIRTGRQGQALREALTDAIRGQASELVRIITLEEQRVEKSLDSVRNAIDDIDNEIARNANREIIITTQIEADFEKFARDLAQFRAENLIANLEITQNQARSRALENPTASNASAVTQAENTLATAIADSYNLQRRNLEAQRVAEIQALDQRRIADAENIRQRIAADRADNDAARDTLLAEVDSQTAFISDLRTTYKNNLEGLDLVLNSFGESFDRILIKFLGRLGLDTEATEFGGTNTNEVFGRAETSLSNARYNIITTFDTLDDKTDELLRSRLHALDLETAREEQAINLRTQLDVERLTLTQDLERRKTQVEQQEYATRLEQAQRNADEISKTFDRVFDNLQQDTGRLFDDLLEATVFDRADTSFERGQDRGATLDNFAKNFGRNLTRQFITEPLGEGFSDFTAGLFGFERNKTEGPTYDAYGRLLVNTGDDPSIGERTGGNRSERRGAFEQIGENIRNRLKGVVSGLGDRFKEFTGNFGGLLSKFGGGFKNILGSAFKGLGSIFGSIGGGLGSAAGGLGSLLGRGIGSIFGGPIGGAVGGFLGNLLPFQQGGLVPKRFEAPARYQYFNTGGLVQRDRVPSMLEPGEFVVRRQAVQSLGLENLRNINRTGNQTAQNVVVNVKNENVPGIEFNVTEYQDAQDQRIIDVVTRRLEEGDAELTGAIKNV